MIEPTSQPLPPNSVGEQSRQLQDVYRQLADDAAAREADSELRTLTEEEARFAASQWTMIWRRFRHNKAAIVGGLIVTLYYLVALFANFVSPYGLSTRNIDLMYLPPQAVHFELDGIIPRPYVNGVESGRDPLTLKKIHTATDEKIYIKFFAKGKKYTMIPANPFFDAVEWDVHLFEAPGGVISIMGRDGQGRDLFSRIVLGARVSLFIGLAGVVLSLVLGTVLGIASGYYGGWVDEVIQRLIEIVRAFPSIPLWMALSAAIPQTWSQSQRYFAVTMILSIIGWTWLARQLRGQVLALRESDYVMAAKLAGASDSRIIFKHLVPATLGQIIVVTTLSLPAMILAETSLSFLGLGLRPPITSWGVLLKEAQDLSLSALALYPWVFLPAVVMLIVMLAFSFLGDGLRDAADPFTIWGAMDPENVLEINDLQVHFRTLDGTVCGIDGVTLDVRRSETLGVVGESGCGKSVTAHSIMRLLPKRAARISRGEIWFRHGSKEHDLAKVDPEGDLIRDIRGNEIAMIFQEPMTSLSPLHTIGDQIMEAIVLHQGKSKKEAEEHAIEMLTAVRIGNAREFIRSYPHQYSGGMRQRAMIAMALACNPQVLIADEPTTALDVTIQAQILDLMRKLQHEFESAIIMITHNLGIINEMSDRIAVMYLGKIIEIAERKTLFKRPAHPYTVGLMQSVPEMGNENQTRLLPIPGMIPDPFNVPQGCAFHPRCPVKQKPAACTDPAGVPVVEIEPGHWARCTLYGG